MRSILFDWNSLVIKECNCHVPWFTECQVSLLTLTTFPSVDIIFYQSASFSISRTVLPLVDTAEDKQWTRLGLNWTPLYCICIIVAGNVTAYAVLYDTCCCCRCCCCVFICCFWCVLLCLCYMYCCCWDSCFMSSCLMCWWHVLLL